jgi:hypothetical protein
LLESLRGDQRFQALMDDAKDRFERLVV